MSKHNFTYTQYNKGEFKMAFLDEKKPTMTQDARKASIEKEITALVKARGFETDGRYRFDPNPNINRKEGSIINGTVKGQFNIQNADGDIIVFEREDFPERTWKKICSIMGFKYHCHTDIDKFTILAGSVEVAISLVTPVKDDD